MRDDIRKLFLLKSEKSFRDRKQLNTVGQHAIRQMEQAITINRDSLAIPEYPGTNRGDTIGPIHMADLNSEFCVTFIQKKKYWVQKAELQWVEKRR